MAFNLTAELQLQANQRNINQVVGQIQNQLAPLGNVTVNVKTNAKAVQQAANQVQRLDKGLRSSQKSASELNRTLVESARRFSVITVATGSLLSLVNAFRNSVKSPFSASGALWHRTCPISVTYGNFSLFIFPIWFRIGFCNIVR